MNTYWFNKLLDVLRVQTNSENEKLMVLYLDRELRKLKLPYTIDAAGNILVTKGEAKTYPCVTSHMDTVHSFVSDFEIYTDKDDNDVLFALDGKRKVGIGGDDKCGVFACLYLLKTMPQIKVVFFSREEVGCKGSKDIDKGFFSDCRYLIQLDRRGSRDFIQTYWSKKTVSHEFSSEIGIVKKKYKYKNTTGTVTDVMKLWDDHVGISCINLSCGYYQPHTNWEHISIEALWNSVKFTEEIINTMQPKRYVSLPPAPTVTHVLYQTNYQCAKCKKWKGENLLYAVWNKIGHVSEKICWSCKQETKSNYKRLQCDKCLMWFLETTMSITGEHTLCKPCNAKSTKAHDSTLTDSNIVTFACHECGKRTDEMKKGDSLKYAGNDNYLYCNECASILFSASDEEKSTKCEVCEQVIPKGHYQTEIQDMLVCGICAQILDKAVGVEDSPEKCWVCEKVIPKDHKVIERFGVRVCEYCATQEELAC